MAEQLTLHQGDNLLDDVIEVERRRLRVGLFRERTDATDHLSRPLGALDDVLSGATRFVQVGSFAVEPAQASLGVGDDGGERLVYFMGDRCGQLAQGRRACGMGEICLRFAKSLLGPIALDDETVEKK